MAIKKVVPKQKKVYMKQVDIYDVSDLSDMPEEYLKEFKRCKVDAMPTTKNVLELFQSNPGEISLNMLMAAYFRKFKELVLRKRVQESVSYLKNKKVVQGLGNGYYRYIGENS